MTDFSENAEQNPAATAGGKKLPELFAADPLSLAETDRKAIISALRKQRTDFVAKQNAPKKQTKKSAAKKAAGDLSIDIGDINL